MRRLFAPSDRLRLPLARMGLVFATALTLSGCINATTSSGPSASVANAQASMGDGPSIAFESVDGPPPHIFDRLVEALDSEAKLRQVAVVSRQGSAAYRVRTYLAAIVDSGKTSISWVWDVYDRDQGRSLRITGEEKVAGTNADAWTLADDVVLRRIAQAGLTGLKDLIGATATPAAPPPTAEPAQAVADADTSPSFANAQASMIAR